MKINKTSPSLGMSLEELVLSVVMKILTLVQVSILYYIIEKMEGLCLPFFMCARVA